MHDLLYVAIAIAFFVACDRWIAHIEERTSERRR